METAHSSVRSSKAKNAHHAASEKSLQSQPVGAQVLASQRSIRKSGLKTHASKANEDYAKEGPVSAS